MSIHSDITAALGIERSGDPLSLPALTLAYIGDTIYDLYVRTLLAETVQAQVHALHLIAAKHVCAAGQAAAYRRIAPMLSEREQAAFRLGGGDYSAPAQRLEDATRTAAPCRKTRACATTAWRPGSKRCSDICI